MSNRTVRCVLFYKNHSPVLRIQTVQNYVILNTIIGKQSTAEQKPTDYLTFAKEILMTLVSFIY